MSTQVIRGAPVPAAMICKPSACACTQECSQGTETKSSLRFTNSACRLWSACPARRRGTAWRSGRLVPLGDWLRSGTVAAGPCSPPPMAGSRTCHVPRPPAAPPLACTSTPSPEVLRCRWLSTGTTPAPHGYANGAVLAGSPAGRSSTAPQSAYRWPSTKTRRPRWVPGRTRVSQPGLLSVTRHPPRPPHGTIPCAVSQSCLASQWIIAGHTAGCSSTSSFKALLGPGMAAAF